MARLMNINPGQSGKFLNRYDLEYVLDNGARKTYEIVSHNPNLTEDQIGRRCDAVVLVTFDASHQHILLGREFRMGCNCFLYNNIAGFIDPGESIEEAAARELREETGLELTKILTVLPFAPIAPSLTDARSALVVCEAAGTIVPSDNPVEEIQASWFSKDAVRDMLYDPNIVFSARTQMTALMWLDPLRDAGINFEK